MAKHKIPKNRSIEDMFQGVEEESTFETTGWEDDEVSGSILLDIKMAYFKDGVGDISLEVVKDGRNVVIKTAPKTSKKLRK